jgi:CheY-like chemotaxis protein
MADILLVDDDAEVAELLAEVLHLDGHAVRIARNGEEGIAQLSERRPELVLLDVEMPVLTGPEMAHRMFVRNCGDEKIPIVLLSGILRLSQVAAIVGTPYYLAKPYRLDEVLALIARALAERAQPRPSPAARMEEHAH